MLWAVSCGCLWHVIQSNRICYCSQINQLFTEYILGRSTICSICDVYVEENYFIPYIVIPFYKIRLVCNRDVSVLHYHKYLGPFHVKMYIYFSIITIYKLLTVVSVCKTKKRLISFLLILKNTLTPKTVYQNQLEYMCLISGCRLFLYSTRIIFFFSYFLWNEWQENEGKKWWKVKETRPREFLNHLWVYTVQRT